jgi:hypothetical protein
LIRVGPPLGPTEWEGFQALNHAQVRWDEDWIGVLLRLDLPEQQEDGGLIPASQPYRFEPIDGSGLPAMASLHSEAILAELRLLHTESR